MVVVISFLEMRRRRSEDPCSNVATLQQKLKSRDVRTRSGIRSRSNPRDRKDLRFFVFLFSKPSMTYSTMLVLISIML